MYLDKKNILIVGLAKTGISTIKYLSKLGANIIVNDIKKEEDLKEILCELKSINNIKYILGYHPENIDNIDLVVVSPGVPLDLDFILKIKNKKIDLIGEVELSYRINNNPYIIGITGTNGKTTTTSLTYEIFKKGMKDAYKVGNIGNPIIDTVETVNKDSVLIAELSSFQLESINSFRPNISVILNITEDHLNRHKTMENYINAKFNIFKNQTKDDFVILNYDDFSIRELESKINSNIIYFSTKEKLDRGIYLEEDNIIINLDKKINLINKNKLTLKGEHNIQNAMASILISYIYGIDISDIKYVLENFSGVEHRQELVADIKGIKFINDSKATNPDSTIKALNSYNEKIILILGGMDKGTNFDEVLEVAKKNVKGLILLGETKDKINSIAIKKGFTNIKIVNNMNEAVLNSYKMAEKGDIVLLSPACASWDMYKSFEVRGKDFKENVYNIK